MSARSKRLAGPMLVTAAMPLTDVYTCPAGKVALIKSIRVTTPTTTAGGFTLGLGSKVNGSIVARVALAGNSMWVDTDTDPLVLHAGDVLWVGQFSAPGSGDLAVTISGAELLA